MNIPDKEHVNLYYWDQASFFIYKNPECPAYRLWHAIYISYFENYGIDEKFNIVVLHIHNVNIIILLHILLIEITTKLFESAQAACVSLSQVFILCLYR